MKKFIPLICILFCTLLLHAQSVSYTYKPFAAEGCSVEYSPSWQEGKPFLIVIVKSDRMKFVSNPVLLLKTANGETIRLEGTSVDVSTSSTGIVSGNIGIPVQEFNATAQFPIEERHIELLNQGITKVRISLIPMNHERTFNKDKIGKKLYNAFLKTKQSDDSF